jgi:hypothetical protein
LGFRALEEGNLELAAESKEELENKQREARKPFKNRKEAEWWQPRWFQPAKHPRTGTGQEGGGVVAAALVPTSQASTHRYRTGRRRSGGSRAGSTQPSIHAQVQVTVPESTGSRN